MNWQVYAHLTGHLGLSFILLRVERIAQCARTSYFLREARTEFFRNMKSLNIFMMTAKFKKIVIRSNTMSMKNNLA
jgi:hypothetical protein